jgi:hypothetical protein
LANDEETITKIPSALIDKTKQAVKNSDRTPSSMLNELKELGKNIATEAGPAALNSALANIPSNLAKHPEMLKNLSEVSPEGKVASYLLSLLGNKVNSTKESPAKTLGEYLPMIIPGVNTETIPGKVLQGANKLTDLLSKLIPAAKESPKAAKAISTALSGAVSYPLLSELLNPNQNPSEMGSEALVGAGSGALGGLASKGLENISEDIAKGRSALNIRPRSLSAMSPNEIKAVAQYPLQNRLSLNPAKLLGQTEENQKNLSKAYEDFFANPIPNEELSGTKLNFKDLTGNKLADFLEKNRPSEETKFSDFTPSQQDNLIEEAKKIYGDNFTPKNMIDLVGTKISSQIIPSSKINPLGNTALTKAESKIILGIRTKYGDKPIDIETLNDIKRGLANDANWSVESSDESLKNQAARNFSNILRDNLATKYPQLQELNKQYGPLEDVRNITEKALRMQSSAVPPETKKGVISKALEPLGTLINPMLTVPYKGQYYNYPLSDRFRNIMALANYDWSQAPLTNPVSQGALLHGANNADTNKPIPRGLK